MTAEPNYPATMTPALVALRGKAAARIAAQKRTPPRPASTAELVAALRRRVHPPEAHR